MTRCGCKLGCDRQSLCTRSVVVLSGSLFLCPIVSSRGEVAVLVKGCSVDGAVVVIEEDVRDRRRHCCSSLETWCHYRTDLPCRIVAYQVFAQGGDVLHLFSDEIVALVFPSLAWSSLPSMCFQSW